MKYYLILFCFFYFSACNSQQPDNKLAFQTDTLKTYYSNGNIKSEEIVNNGLKNGFSTYYNEDGSIYQSKCYLNDTLNGKVFNYRNGNILSEANFKSGKLDGYYLIFENSDTIRQLQYKNGTLIHPSR